MELSTKKPRVKITLTTTDRLFEVVGWSLLISMWIVVIMNYASLPGTIPIHFNNQGVVDGYGQKSMIWILPSLASLLFIGMTLLNKFPHFFNYLTTITPDNAKQQYTIATRMVRFIKVMMTFSIGFLVWKTILISDGQSAGLGSNFTPLILGLILAPLLYYIFKLLKNG